jgi:hypothetical protein
MMYHDVPSLWIVKVVAIVVADIDCDKSNINGKLNASALAVSNFLIMYVRPLQVLAAGKVIETAAVVQFTKSV